MNTSNDLVGRSTSRTAASIHTVSRETVGPPTHQRKPTWRMSIVTFQRLARGNSHTVSGSVRDKRMGFRETSRSPSSPIAFCSECVLIRDSQQTENTVEILLIRKLHTQLAFAFANGDVHFGVETIAQTFSYREELRGHLCRCT